MCPCWVKMKVCKARRHPSDRSQQVQIVFLLLLVLFICEVDGRVLVLVKQNLKSQDRLWVQRSSSLSVYFFKIRLGTHVNNIYTLYLNIRQIYANVINVHGSTVPLRLVRFFVPCCFCFDLLHLHCTRRLQVWSCARHWVGTWANF